MKKYPVILLLLFAGNVFAQNHQIDSLRKALQGAKEDTSYLKTLNGLSKQLYNIGNYDTATYYADKAKMLAEKMISKQREGNEIPVIKKQLAQSYNNIGLIHTSEGKYSEALKNHLTALKMRQTIEDKQGIAGSYNNIGLIYLNQGNYPEALKNYLTALKINEAMGNKLWISINYTNIGTVYYMQGYFPEALKNYLAALSIKKVLDDKQGIASSYMGIGLVYNDRGNYQEALKNYLAALKIQEKIVDKQGIAKSHLNIGNVYLKRGNLSEALKNYLAALAIQESIGDKNGVGSLYIAIGMSYTKQKKYSEAIAYLNKGLKLAATVGSKENIKSAYEGLAEVYEKTKKYQQAYQCYKKSIAYSDTLVNEANTKKTVQQQMQYEFDKKDAAAKAAQDKKDAIADSEKRKQQLVIYAVSGGLLLMLALAGVIFKSLQTNRRKNKVITLKNREITDSINYAKRIQSAILPSTDLIYKTLKESLILFKPKDVVSGDFYAFVEKDNKVILAAVDCTGHGVPGAFMSMIGHNLLTEIIVERGITKPSDILEHLNKSIKKAMKQSDENSETHDGMDIALVSLKFETQKFKLEFAGAQRPLYHIRAGVLNQIKGDKVSIAGFTEQDYHFTNHSLKLQPGDMMYLFSDGFADQFGGPNGRKMMTKRFREKLLSIQHMSMKEQEVELNKTFEDWKGELEQVDDVLVIGVRV